MQFRTQAVLACAVACAVFATASSAQEAQLLEPVEVTTAKIPVPLSDVAATVTIVSGEELRARNANDLRTALSLVAGVDIAPGGDGGPTSAVPSLWGLREFDAFLLVVDGIPWGGAFTPALASLDIANVERIEVLKGAAPVSYGATSFVGVIHVIHYAAGQGSARVEAGVGTRGSGHVAIAMPLSDANAPWRQSILFDADTVGLSGDRTGWDRAHLLYRGAGDLGGGEFTVDADGTWLKQDPGSPHPLEDDMLSDRVPLDANDNPRGAKNDENRGQLAFGYVLPTSIGDWSSRLAYAKSNADNVRGFLREDFADDGVTHNADGFSQSVDRTEVYFDSHFATPVTSQATLVWGLDYLYGKGEQDSKNFEYAVLPNGSNAPDWRSLHIDETTRLDDKRNFLGVYADLQYAITDAWHFEIGARFNHTNEKTNGLETDLTGEVPVVTDGGSDERTDNRWAGVFGTSYRFWQEGKDYITGYVNYRDTFKPAVVDFGPEAEFDILKPEDAQSAEIGLRGTNMDGHFEWDVSAFHMDFDNLVVAEEEEGLPSLGNAGKEKFKGAEAEARWNFGEGMSVVGTYAYHNARFGHFVTENEDGEEVDLKGNLLELSPQHLGSIGLMFAPPQGFRAYAVMNYVGKRFLDRDNDVSVDSYETFDAGFGYAWDRWEVRVDGYNLSDRRDVVSESELGPEQFYRMPARTYWLTARYSFGK
ncbi:MAG TPA: TonB-dependent receptor [Rhodanobacteraceae bacterium]|nr:TonB-dependent receptor [Rhodanobacteraceae bacterium]